jgi:hypothetical protein
MEWVEATGLIPFIESHLWQSSVLGSLAMEFADMIKDLSALGIAHGDLQHGNLLVTRSGRLKLVDYDGMFVPGLEQLGASEIGHINYQSPWRNLSVWGPYLDHFSAWIIYASLVALAIDPTLWPLLHADGDEALLFHKDDFTAPGNSPAMLAFAQSPDTTLQALARALEPIWTSPIDAIPPLDPRLLGGDEVKRLVSPLDASVHGNAPVSGVPDWISEAKKAGLVVPDEPGDPSWIAAHLEPAPVFPFNPPRAFLRALTSIWLAVVAGVMVLAATGVLVMSMTGLLEGLLVLAFVAGTSALFLTTPERTAKRQSNRIIKTHRAEKGKAAGEVRRIEMERNGVDAKERKSIANITKRADELGFRSFTLSGSALG